MDGRYMELARAVAGFSKDGNTKVGAVIVDERNRIVSTGYNGMPPKVREKHLWVNKKNFVVHAEANAMLYSYRYLGGCHVYVTHAPCIHCLVQLWTVGVRVIFYETLSTKTPLTPSAKGEILLFLDACDGQLLVKNMNHNTYQEELNGLP